nr:MAG TPA: large terminase [Caudoviricetes sp.]
MTWAYKFGTTNSQFIFVNKDGDQAKANLKRLGDQTRVLPEYMRGNAIVDENGSLQKGKDNATMITNPINGNSIITKAKATSYESGLSLARGMTAPIESGHNSSIKTSLIAGNS